MQHVDSWKNLCSMSEQAYDHWENCKQLRTKKNDHFKRLQRPVVVVKGVSSWDLLVVVLARGKQGFPDAVTCFKRTDSGTFS